MKTNLDALNAKKKELIEQIEDEILKIQKNTSIFDLEFLENYEKKHIINSDALLDIHILFGNKGLDIFCKKLTGDIIIDFGLDFLKKDIVDYVIIGSTYKHSYQEFYEFNQDEKFINSFIEELNKYKNYLLELEISAKSNYESYLYLDIYDYELYRQSLIPYSIATNTQRIYKIFCNTCSARAEWEYSIWEAIYRVPSKAVAENSPIDKENFRKLIIDQRVNPYYLDIFLKKVEALELEDSLEELFYIVQNIVCNWGF